MSRRQVQRKTKEAIVIIVDGYDEKWYISKARDYYPNDAIRSVKIKPELVQHKRCKDLFDSAHQRIIDGATHVILVLDFDTIRKDSADYADFKRLYSDYHSALNNEKNCRKNKWMCSVTVLVNNPCLEYWYLLHYKQTTKLYDCFDSVERDLKKISALSDYDKSKDYYNGNPDIFIRLGGLQGLEKARINSRGNLFSISECNRRGVSEMAQLFDFFDRL